MKPILTAIAFAVAFLSTAFAEERSVPEVFDKRARGICHALQDRVPRFAGCKGEERMVPRLVHPARRHHAPPVLPRVRHRGGRRVRQRHRRRDGQHPLRPGDHPQGRGPRRECRSRWTTAPATSEIEVSFRDLFAKTDSKETEKSGGTSTKITIEAEEGVEGIGSIKESLEQEVHAEFAESEGTETTNEREGEEGTIVPVGKRVLITETRQRADTELEVTSNAVFTHQLHVGQHDHRWNHGWKGHRGRGNFFWETWDDFVEVLHGRAPSNYDLAESFAKHPLRHADGWVFDALEGEVKYKVRFEGKIIKVYTVQGVRNDGSLEPVPKDATDDRAANDEWFMDDVQVYRRTRNG